MLFGSKSFYGIYVNSNSQNPIEECENGVPYVITEWACNNISPNASTFEWSNGSSVAVPEFTAEGTYSLTVTDLNGCTATGELVVSFEEYKSISGYAWVDNPMFNDNVADNGDDRYEGIVVNLYTATGVFQESTISDMDGNYLFGNLTEGEYYIETELPTGYIYLEANVGLNDFIDNDIDPTTGRSAFITVGDCNANNAIGIGLKEQ